MEQGIVRSFFKNLPDEKFPFRSWTYQRHISPQHVPELRQFVQPVLPQKLSDGGYAGVPFGGQPRAVVLGVAHHRAELDDAERLLMEPDALLKVEHRSAGIALYKEGYDGKRRKQAYQRQGGDDDVAGPFHIAGGLRHIRRADVYKRFGGDVGQLWFGADQLEGGGSYQDRDFKGVEPVKKSRKTGFLGLGMFLGENHCCQTVFLFQRRHFGEGADRKAVESVA